MQLYLIRHTAPDVPTGICYGQSDIPLAETFEQEWEILREKLLAKADVIYSSPLSRCLKLAAKIQFQFDLPIIKDDRLMEMNFGDWELQNWNDIDQIELNAWMNNYHSVKCPRGECYEDVLKRVNSFLQELKSSNKKSIIVVTHAGVIKLAESILNPDPLKNVLAMKVTYGGIYQYQID